MPGSVLLSHGETPHYHRRYAVSLPSSRWDRVVPTLCCRQANWLGYLMATDLHGWRNAGNCQEQSSVQNFGFQLGVCFEVIASHTQFA